MSIKHIVTLTLLAFFLGACSEKAPPQSELAKRAESQEPVLTSTVSRNPVGTDIPEPSKMPQRDDAKPVEEREQTEEPTTKQAPSFDPVVESIDGVAIQRFVTTSAIDEREPTDPTSTFSPRHERVYAFVEVSNESESNKSLFVHFIGPKEKVSGGVELEIPASVPRWRTWAYTRHFEEPGLWRVEIRDVDGALLGALPFEVEPGF